MDQNVVQEAHKLLEKDGSFATRPKAYILYNYFDWDIYAMKKSSVCDDGKIIDKTTINVCFKLENIIKEWNAVMEYAHSIRVDEEASCGYLIYWLYGKVKDSKCDDSDIYWIYNKLSEPLENICFKDKKDKFGRKFVKLYDRNILKSKKELHDFVEYYKFIKVNVNKNITNKKVYCRYIEYIFDLYHKMNQDHNLKCTGLYEEINHFENTFKHENGELNSLKNICSDISQKLVLEVNNKISCPSEQEENAYKEKFKKKPAASADSQNFTEIESPKKTQEKIKLEDNISEKLSSLKIYEELNNANNIDFNNSYCKELEINDTKAKNICAHVVKNLKKMTELHYIKEHNEYCLHFVRWIYEEICKIPGIDWKNIYKNPDITKLFRVQFPINSKSPKYRCYYDFAGNINEWKEKADLLDYFQIFDKINNDTTCVNDKCKKNCTFFENINKLYKKHKKKCCTRFHYGGYFDNCLDYFKCDNKYNPKTFISKLKCQIEKSNENTEELDEPIPIDENVILKSLKSLSLVNFPKIKCNGLMCDTFSFTPFGTWLNKRLMKRRNGFTLDEDINYFQQNMLGRGNVNSQNRRINIAYQTA